MVDRTGLRQIDLAQVHSDAIPAWVLARGDEREQSAEALLSLLEPDRNLVALATRVRALSSGDPSPHGAEIMGLIATWNAYLDQAGEPWRLEAELSPLPDGRKALGLRSYAVTYDGSTTVGGRPYRTRLQRRVDDTALVESYLGHVRDWREGVLLLHDRIQDYALDEVWTLLDPAAADLSSVEQAFAPSLRAAIAEALGPDAAAELEASASLRRDMLAVIRSVHSRHACGSRFLIARVPWDGFGPEDIARLQRHAAAVMPPSCPDLTPDEARRLVAASEALRARPALRPALEHLTAWVAGAVVAHEARHAADDASERPVVCAACPPAWGRVASLEASAYVASFAVPGRGVLSMLQACELDPIAAPVQADAVSFVLVNMEARCASGPPDEMVARARGVEVALFGRYTPMDLADFPTALPLDAAVSR